MDFDVASRRFEQWSLALGFLLQSLVKESQDRLSATTTLTAVFTSLIVTVFEVKVKCAQELRHPFKAVIHLNEVAGHFRA